MFVFRFGKVVCCEVIRDKKSGESLQYAFVEFEEKVGVTRVEAILLLSFDVGL